jgi:hypothetical protein
VMEIADRRLRAQEGPHAVAGERHQGQHVVALIRVEGPARGDARQPQERGDRGDREEREPVEPAQGCQVARERPGGPPFV